MSQLDIDKTDLSPRRAATMAAVGGEAPFAQGQSQMKLLAGLEITAKAVERTAEPIGADMKDRQQKIFRSAKQLHLRSLLAHRLHIFTYRWMGRKMFVVKSEAQGRAGRTPGSARPHCANAEISAPSSPRLLLMICAGLCGITSTTYVGAIESAEEVGAPPIQRGLESGLGPRYHSRGHG